MSGEEKEQQTEPKADADAEPPKKEPPIFEEYTAELLRNPRFVRVKPSGQLFILGGCQSVS
jgi:hypothetical protein